MLLDVTECDNSERSKFWNSICSTPKWKTPFAFSEWKFAKAENISCSLVVALFLLKSAYYKIFSFIKITYVILEELGIGFGEKFKLSLLIDPKN